jgi:hypothetical protein
MKVASSVIQNMKIRIRGGYEEWSTASSVVICSWQLLVATITLRTPQPLFYYCWKTKYPPSIIKTKMPATKLIGSSQQDGGAGRETNHPPPLRLRSLVLVLSRVAASRTRWLTHSFIHWELRRFILHTHHIIYYYSQPLTGRGRYKSAVSDPLISVFFPKIFSSFFAPKAKAK